MISRRGLFRLLSGAAVSPVLKPLAGLIPVSGIYAAAIRRWALELEKQSDVSRHLEVYYSTRLLDTLRANTCLDSFTKSRPLPFHSGKTIQFFTYKLPEGLVETV